jgi:gliding motility-associated-like protein
MKLHSQVIEPPDLQCVQNDAANGNITLQWTNPLPNPCGAFVQYTIYASSSGVNGPYNPIAVTNQSATSFTLINYLGTAPTWYFYMEASYNCPGTTVLQSDTVNNLNPAVPEIVNVDVTQGGIAVFNWLPSTSPQTHGYVIYYYLPQNGGAVLIDTIYGRYNTTFTDLAADPTTQSLYYTVSAFDSCFKFSSYNTLAHNTIYATGTTAACQNDIKLNWNGYNNWPQGVKEYQILASVNGSAFAVTTTVDSSTRNYSYTNFIDGDSICIIIRAISAADTTIVSNSNMICMRPIVVQPPRFIYITNITVLPDNHVQTTWMIDTIAELTYYKVERSDNGTSFVAIKQFNVPSPLTTFEIFIDSSNIRPQDNPFYYKVATFDSCNQEYNSPSGKTICLKGELYDYYISNLKWNDFELFGATVTQYKLYRNFGSGYQQIATFNPGINEFTDSLQQFVNEEGLFCYKIEAVYSLNLPNGFVATLSSFSNEMCIIHRPIIYIPNAFAPNGLNNVFKPTIIYGDPKGYSMSIFNRWGGKIFETNNPDVGWDGNDNGKPGQMGGYAYLIQFNAADGVRIERKGIVLLVK